MYRVAIYKVEDGEWKFHHALQLGVLESLGEAAGIANGYNGGSLRDPKWLFLAVAEPIED